MKTSSIIAISGKSGCGNSTVSRLLAERLHRRLINYTFHNLADELGIPFTELLEKAKTDFSYDRMLDNHQIKLAGEADCVIGSRLAIWLIPQADLKIYLYADPEIRATRVHQREGGSIEEIVQFTQKRDEMDTARYQQIYSINNDSYNFVDLIINAGRMSPERIVNTIIAALPASKL
ncbi:MAG: cytidylate kinase family protein [Spirochaetes bacterium]|nr:cytidylate kinase family protein [Spirochaetota bacterium]